jgi:hypothetical protein
MSNDLNKLTVAELRAEISGHPRVASGDMPMPGLSKKRKSELVEILTELHGHDSLPVAVVDDIAVTAEELQEFVGDVMSTDIRTVQLLGQGLNDLNASFTAAERRELNEAKYQGRYAGKTFELITGYDRVHGENIPRTVLGTIVDRVHRDSDPLNCGNGKGLLLLVVKHGDLPRTTLHRAEDVSV